VAGGVDGGSVGGVGGFDGVGSAVGIFAAGSSAFTFASTNELGVSPARRQPTIVTDLSSIRADSGFPL
jgi:hypothetical protein